MGEIAEMMLDGTLCEGCGCALPGHGEGFPRRCGGCARDERAEPATRAKVKPRSSKADLPKWKHQSDDDISVRYHCNHCLRHFPTDVSARDHVRDVHGAAS